ncbi:MAG: transposase [Verrucomicrobia bacterium]|nr:transposase [Verrucomicrobiota bacterium]MBS0636653.1 transposase [Verrucomicrobiota bacterium]
MARRQRSSIPGATYHVMLRGNNGQNIFRSDQERCTFCLLLQQGIERYGHRILAFCFMSNHVHLAIQLDQVSLSKIIQNLAFRYTRFYNWRHNTIGHLFQGRFKSLLVDSDRYLRELVRYIHLNPVRAKMVDSPAAYRWSSHRAYLMMSEYSWLSQNEVLVGFGTSKSEAIDALNAYVLAGIGLEEEAYFETGISEGILGEEQFIKTINVRCEKECLEKPSIDLATLVSFISKKYEVDLHILPKLGMDRKSTHIRAVTALLARESRGVTLEELAVYFGREASGISKAAARLESRMQRSEDLELEVKNLLSEFSC